MRKKKAKDSFMQIRIHGDLLKWLDDFAARHDTDRTKVVTEYLMMLRRIDEGRKKE